MLLKHALLNMLSVLLLQASKITLKCRQRRHGSSIDHCQKVSETLFEVLNTRFSFLSRLRSSCFTAIKLRVQLPNLQPIEDEQSSRGKKYKENGKK